MALYLYKKYTVTKRLAGFHNGVMEVEKRNCLKQPAVAFQLVSRKLTPAQVEAGKRLFKKLVARAQSGGGVNGRG